MECPACKANLTAESKFCNQCGIPLAQACPACGHGNTARSKFCNECGATLTPGAPTLLETVPQATSSAPSGPAAERRQLSVMFCDLVGSVALAERLDPEDLHDLLAKYQRLGTKIVESGGGLVARYQGDGILAYFGYPVAHEHDAEQAVNTGLELVDAVGELGPAHETLQVRIGIATGVVIVGELVQSAQMDEVPIVGETPNLAARLQAIAEPNTIVIDDRTHRLTGRLFEYDDLGLLKFKGFTKPLRAWRVIERSDVESRFEALHSSDQPLAGRQEELELLIRRWSRAKSGEGQVVLLSGQAGIGKSRLAAALEAQLLDQPYARMRYFCSPQHQGSGLYPVISQLTTVAGIARLDSDDQKFDKLCSLLAPSIKDPLDLALIAELLSISTKGRFPQVELSPQVRKLRTFAALQSIIREISSHQPLLIVFEDAHWIDPTSLELTEHCIDAAEHQKLLLIMTSRTAFSPPWADRPYVTHLSLNRLPRSHALAMIKNIAGSMPLREEIFEQILDRTDGVPLFVEELTKTVIESELAKGRGEVATMSPGAQAIPSTLQASLLARLDRLSPVRDVVQIGAAIGREFSFELLSAVYRFSVDQLKETLRQLVSAELIYRRTDPPNESYKFKHALVQDAAYSTLLRPQRKELHARIAKALEEGFPDRASTEPEVLAYHFSQADLIQLAIKYWQAAAKRAAERAGNVEAVDYYDKALAILQTIPETPARDQQELMLLVGRGLPLTAIGSYAAPDVGENYRRAHALCNRMGTAPQIFPVLQGLYRFYLVGAELQNALDTTRQLLDIANKVSDQSLLMEAHQAQAFSLGFRGELPAAQEHFDKCMALFDPDHFRGRMHLYSTDTATSALCLGALIAWLTGYPDRSAATTGQALARAREVDHPYTLAWALSFSAVLYQLRGEVSMTRDLAEECVALCQQHDFPFWLASGRIMRGWALADEGEQAAVGIAELREGLDGWHKTGARVYAPYFTCCFAEACISAGQPADGLGPLAEMIAVVERTGEGWWQPELYRLTGELLSRQAQVAESNARPEYFFRKALELAIRQNAKSLALRATMSLCRSWLRQGLERTKAREELAAIYRTFDEGSSTRDLRMARQMLDELS
ncbi:AAA family ATPase [Bradyrhizobium sp. AUGA SZCCT0222]|uniref:adenylate/guanylate cyclase domain-containing protein n=1 Tax=Bradyrhizobium sp. AUGA SZCCT0222 TaxID=2807668 RepID=UPI001BA971C1|nr:adenylate/guanylate cyclase domain-containing protein [Bradyrhizobium sp. AUGA SZCCT0222]MBR1271939.1 AAA family ATPase [Bradyrhizobium sp. AUGA SZCCT0222]